MRLKEWVTRWWKHASESRAILVAVFVVVTMGLLAPHLVFAQDETKLLEFAESSAIILANLLTMFTNVLGSLLILLTEVVLTNIMQYNNFSGSAVIGAGWAVVRDVMNMGFVVAMLIIAMVTIFSGSVGSWSVKWQHQIPRLLLFAILINFSRMICGLLIDIGQVIMLTFANAIKDIAGGNIIELFGLRNMVTFSDISRDALAESQAGIGGFQLLSTAVLGFLMTLIVFGTMLILTVVLVYRIVTLWVLVVLSPIAFFFGGAKGLFGGKVDPYSEWWGKFSSTIAVGPVLVFFLWLALATIGAGSGAVASEFPNTAVRSDLPAGTAGTFISKIAEPGALLAFIIGIGILFAGFEAAGKFADALPGMASNLIKGGVKGALTLGTAATLGAAWKGSKLGFKGSKLAGKYAVAPVAKWAGRTKAGQSVIGGVAKGVRGAAGWVGGSALGMIPGVGMLARGAARAGSTVEATRAKNAAEEFKGHEKNVAEYGADDVRAGLASKAMGHDGAMRQQALRWKALSDDDVRDDMDKDELAEIMQQFIANGGEKTFAGDAGLMKNFKAFKKSRPDLLSPEEKTKTLSKMDNEEFRKLDEEALDDPDVQAALDDPDRFEYDHDAKEDISLRDRIAKGAYGKKLQNKMTKINEGDSSDVDSDTVTDSTLRNLSEDRQTTANLDALKSEQLDVVMNTPNFQIQNLSVDKLANAGRASKLAGLSPAVLARLLRDPAKAEAFHTGLAEHVRQNGASMSPADQNKVTTAMLATSSGPSTLVDGGIMQADGSFPEGGSEVVRTAAQTAPTFLLNHTETLQTNNQFTQQALRGVNMTALNKSAREAVKGGDPAEQAKYVALYDALEARAKEEMGRISARASVVNDRLKTLYTQGENAAGDADETARITAELAPLEAERAESEKTMKQLRNITNRVSQMFQD